MKIGRRTQAYFVGFLIGVAMVSVLIDSRRERAARNRPEVYTWERIPASVEVLPEELRSLLQLREHVTGVERLDAQGVPTGVRGFFFADADGHRFWWVGSKGAMRLCDGERLKAESHAGLEWDLMRAGFEHQGHAVLSDPSEAPGYLLGIEVHSAVEMVAALENLRSKRNYVAQVDWVEVDDATLSVRMGK
jgi:hypothetical protein